MKRLINKDEVIKASYNKIIRMNTTIFLRYLERVITLILKIKFVRETTAKLYADVPCYLYHGCLLPTLLPVIRSMFSEKF